MKKTVLLVCLAALAIHVCPLASHAQGSEFETFLRSFDYEVRDAMKIDSKGLVPLLAGGKAVLVDVRFKEEVAAWRTVPTQIFFNAQGKEVKRHVGFMDKAALVKELKAAGLR